MTDQPPFTLKKKDREKQSREDELDGPAVSAFGQSSEG
jgi:hypothetical protein